MSFITQNEKIEPTLIQDQGMKFPFYKKRKWKIFFVILGSILVMFLSFAAYLVASGGKIFQSGLSGSSLLRAIQGGETLSGQSRNRINVLILGVGGVNHPGGLLADSIILTSIQPEKKEAAMLSIPRDLLVSIPGNGEGKVNAAFADGYSASMKSCTKKKIDLCRTEAFNAGADLMSKTVSKTFNQTIDYYVVVDFSGFEKAIDQLGGIDVYVDKAISDPLFPDKSMQGYEPFYLKAGQHKMDGALALKYARSRQTSSDFDRAERQQKILIAVRDKVLKANFLSNPKKLADLTSTLGDSIKTNLELAQARTLFELVSDVPSGKIRSLVLANGQGGYLVDYNNGSYYLKPRSGDYKEIQNFVANIFTAEDKVETATVEVLNGSKTTGLAGKVADKIEASGYTVSKIENAKENYAKTVIYDYTSGKKPNTAKYLAELTGGSVVKKADPNSAVDFSVILGEDYASKVSTKK